MAVAVLEDQVAQDTIIHLCVHSYAVRLQHADLAFLQISAGLLNHYPHLQKHAKIKYTIVFFRESKISLKIRRQRSVNQHLIELQTSAFMTITKDRFHTEQSRAAETHVFMFQSLYSHVTLALTVTDNTAYSSHQPANQPDINTFSSSSGNHADLLHWAVSANTKRDHPQFFHAI